MSGSMRVEGVERRHHHAQGGQGKWRAALFSDAGRDADGAVSAADEWDVLPNGNGGIVNVQQGRNAGAGASLAERGASQFRWCRLPDRQWCQDAGPR